jgi:HPr kinase/phosphorylase
MTNAIKGIQISQILELNPLKILKIHNEKWLSNEVSHPRPQRPGLGLTGYLKHIQTGRIQIFGKTEIGYMRNLKEVEKNKFLKNYLSLKLPGIIISANTAIEEELITMAAYFHTPILISELHTAPLISRLNAFLYQYFSKKFKLNGVLMDIMGQGVMLTGASGIGKSETALELVNFTPIPTTTWWDARIRSSKT